MLFSRNHTKTGQSNPTIGVFTPGSEPGSDWAYRLLHDFAGTEFQFLFDRSLTRPINSLLGRPISWDNLQPNEVRLSPQEKAEAFHQLVQNDTVDIVWGFDGPEGSIETLRYIDWDIVKKNPKMVIGFSDISAFLNAVTTKTGTPTIHAENLSSIEPNGKNFNFLMKLLKGEKVSLTSRFVDRTYQTHITLAQSNKVDCRIPQMPRMEVLSQGYAKGKLIGGNLTRLHELHDIGIIPDYKDAILFLEDTGETVQTINLHINSLECMGVFNDIAGLMIGDFSNMIQSSYSSETTLGGIFNRLANTMRQQNKPCISGLPVGHVRNGFSQPRRLFPLPIGTNAYLEAKGHSVSLKSECLPKKFQI